MGAWMCKGQDPPKVLFYGLHAAGKTTLLYRLILGDDVRTTTVPITLTFNLEVVNLTDDHQLALWDVGGRSPTRMLHRHYLANTTALVYVVDSSDTDQMDPAFEELVKSYLGSEEGQDTVCMVLANKQDLAGAMTVPEVEDSLRRALGDKAWSQTFFVCPVSALTGVGVNEAFVCFMEQMELKKSQSPTRGLISVDYTKRTDDGSDNDRGITTATKYLAKKLLKDPSSYIRSILFY